MRPALLFLTLLVVVACQTAVVPGATCTRNGDCAAPLACLFERCRAQCLEARDCPLGARCLLSGGVGSCSLDVDERCESAGHACPVGLTCLGDHCVNTCTRASDCPRNAMCLPALGTSTSFCFAPGLDDAGTVADASALDAASEGGSCTGPTCSTASDLCVGDGFACAVRSDGAVLCWGSDSRGQLGDGDTTETPHAYAPCSSGLPCSPRPTRVLTSTGAPLSASRIACAGDTACAVVLPTAVGLSDVFCWGTNDSGQAGVSAGVGTARANLVDHLATEVSAMRNGFCGMRSGYIPQCWGYDSADAFLFGTASTDTSISRPTTSGWQGTLAGSLALGLGHICTLAGDTVTCAGQWQEGELNAATVTASSGPPTQIVFPGATASPTALVAGEHFTCALIAGTPWCWGANNVLALGRATSLICNGVACDPVPAPVPGLAGITRMWAGGFESMTCVADAAQTSCWGGTNDVGCLIEGGTCDRPTHIARLDGARHVALGDRSVCAIDRTGGVVCFGANASGELGQGTTNGGIALSDAAVTVCLADDCP